MFVLGDQDNKDAPIRVLSTPADGLLIGERGNPKVVTEADRTRAYEYVEDWKRSRTTKRNDSVGP